MKSEFKYQYNDLQRKWLDDLKTTTEPQAQGHLQVLPHKGYSGGFCCLGRACVVAGLQGKSDDLRYVDFGQGPVSEELPKDLAVPLRLIDEAGAFLRPVTFRSGTYYRLTGLNDDAQWTFKQIAEYIEANPENVFSDYDEQKKAYEESLQRS